MADAQAPNGELGGGVPNAGTGVTAMHNNNLPGTIPFDPSWSAVFPNVAYGLWKYHNGVGSLEYAWPGIQKYMAMLESNYTVTGYTYGMWGDWNPAYPEPRNPLGQGPPFTRTVSHITAAAMVVQNHIQMAEMAKGLGKLREAAKYEAMVPVLKKQYHDAFYDPAAQVYGDGTPTAFGAALWLGVTPPALLPAVVSSQLSVTQRTLNHSCDTERVLNHRLRTLCVCCTGCTTAWSRSVSLVCGTSSRRWQRSTAPMLR